MGKSEFNLDDDFYTRNFENTNGDVSEDEDSNGLYDKDSDFSDVGLTEYNDVIDENNVVYNENDNLSNKEKFEYFFDNTNLRIFIVIGLVVFIVLLILIAVFS